MTKYVVLGVNTKFLKVWKSNNLKSVPQIYFCINQVVITISILIFLQREYSSDSIFFELVLNKKSS